MYQESYIRNINVFKAYIYLNVTIYMRSLQSITIRHIFTLETN
jgi:hypothetical protein